MLWWDAKISRRLLNNGEDDYWKVELNQLFGFLNMRKGQLELARSYLEQAMEEVGHLKEEPAIVDWTKALILHSLATTYGLRDSSIKSQLYQRSDSLYAQIDKPENWARLRLNWGTFFQKMRNYEKGDSLFNLCEAYALAEKDFDLLGQVYQESGFYYFKRYERSEPPEAQFFELALSNLTASLKYPPNNYYQSYEFLGNLYQTSWGFDVDESHVDSAVQYYKIAMEAAAKEGAKEKMKKISRNIANISNWNAGLVQDILGGSIADFFNENYVGVVDTLLTSSQSAYERINRVEQRDIRLSAEQRIQRQFWTGLAVLVALALIALILVQRQQTRRLRAEMNALRAQIDPHFISNSLNAIESLINLGDTKAASKYLVHFSRLSRRILTRSRAAKTTLEDELSTLKHFLMLEQLRFRDKLTFDIRVTSEINANTVIVPAMILQPYVENAIWHGIKPKTEGGHVQVDVRKEGKILSCSIEDNGIGRQQAKALQAASVMQRKSYGMQITEDRLKALGRIKGSQVTIVDLKNELGEASGTKVIINIPFQIKRNQDQSLFTR